MVQWIETYAKTHVFYLILLAGGIFGFHSWLAEHDQRLLTDKQVAVDAQQIKDLQSQLKDVQVQTAAKVAAVMKEKATIKTPVQAMPVINAFDVALNARPVPSLGPDVVAVAAVHLALDLEQCRADRISLGGAQAEISLMQQEDAKKDDQIKALKAKPKFWARLKGDAKSAGFWTSVGVIIAKVVLK